MTRGWEVDRLDCAFPCPGKDRLVGCAVFLEAAGCDESCPLGETLSVGDRFPPALGAPVDAELLIPVPARLDPDTAAGLPEGWFVHPLATPPLPTGTATLPALPAFALPLPDAEAAEPDGCVPFAAAEIPLPEDGALASGVYPIPLVFAGKERREGTEWLLCCKRWLRLAGACAIFSGTSSPPFTAGTVPRRGVGMWAD